MSEITVHKPIGGLQETWLWMLSTSSFSSGLSAEDKRCLKTLKARGYVTNRGWTWTITDLGQDARFNAPRLPFRPRYGR